MARIATLTARSTKPVLPIVRPFVAGARWRSVDRVLAEDGGVSCDDLPAAVAARPDVREPEDVREVDGVGGDLREAGMDDSGVAEDVDVHRLEREARDQVAARGRRPSTARASSARGSGGWR